MFEIRFRTELLHSHMQSLEGILTKFYMLKILPYAVFSG